MAFEFSICDADYEKDFLWFPSVEYNALLKMSTNTGEVYYMGSFPNEDFFQWRLYSKVLKHKGKLYFIPCSAYEIGVYDIERNCFEKINIGISKKCNDLSKVKYAKKFISAFVWGNKLVLLPCCYEKLVIYDFETSEIEYDTSMYECLYESYSMRVTSRDGEFYLCWNASKIDNNTIFFDLHTNDNVYIVYNVLNGKWTDYHVGVDKRSYTFSCFAGNEYWLYDGISNTLSCTNALTNESIEYPVNSIFPTLHLIGNNVDFLNMAVFGEWIYLIPNESPKAVRVHVEEKTFEIVENLAPCKPTNDNPGTAFSNLFISYEGYLYLYDWRKQELNKINATNLKNSIKCYFNEESYTKLKHVHYQNLIDDGNNTILEHDGCDLRDFLYEVNRV